MSDACELARNSKPSKWYHFNSVPGSSRLHVRVLEGKIERQPLRPEPAECNVKSNVPVVFKEPTEPLR